MPDQPNHRARRKTAGEARQSKDPESAWDKWDAMEAQAQRDLHEAIKARRAMEQAELANDPEALSNAEGASWDADKALMLTLGSDKLLLDRAKRGLPAGVSPEDGLWLIAQRQMIDLRELLAPDLADLIAGDA